MAGLGRRTHYRKHLTDSIIYDMPEPNANERIAKVVATRGGNQFDIRLPQTSSSEGSSPTEDVSNKNQEESHLAILPTKFNKLVWVKRNDFVIVETADDAEALAEAAAEEKAATEEKATPVTTTTDKKETAPAVSLAEDTGGIRYIISHILYKDQVKHLQSKGLWPTNDAEFTTGTARGAVDDGADADDSNNDTSAVEEHDDGIVYDTGYGDDDDFLVNTNHIAALTVDDSSDSDSE